MIYKLPVIPLPLKSEKFALRLMIFIGVLSIIFFLYTMFQTGNISYFPLYVLLMITMVYYCFKYLHEWYHYFAISADKKPLPTKVYTVDILTTFCTGEPMDMLEETLTAIQKITYPHTAWCCDEANDAVVKNICERLGVNHVTRVNKDNAKAGNINNALQFATGEICVVLDPDHVPAPEFLDEIAAYFDDDAIGFVQIVQAYYNQEESLVAKGAAQQTYQFYGPMMMGMHKYGTVQAIGANCTFRRRALDSIGGHAAGLAEDMHTAMKLHANGWRSIYVPAIITRGLVPATMSSYFKQQLKWSRGTWELLFTSYPKLFKKFTLRQKIHYLTLPFHYLCGFIFLINVLIPVVSLFTGYIPLKMDVVNFLLAAIPVFTMSIIIRHYVQKWVIEVDERGFHLVGGILQIGTWWIHSIGFIYTIFRKKVPYIPTPKNDNDPLPLKHNLPNIFVALISLIAIVYGLWYDYNPYTIFMVILAAMQVFFMIFIISISGYITSASKVNTLSKKLRGNTWLIIKTHGFIRRYSIILAALLIVLFSFAYYNHQQLPTFLPQPLPELQVFYKGLYLPEKWQRPEFKLPANLLAEETKNVSIIAFKLRWGVGEANQLDTAYLQSIYLKNAVPLLYWNLKQNDSAVNSSENDNSFQQVINGQYDQFILLFAKAAAALNKPLFLRLSADSSIKNGSVFSFKNYGPLQFVQAWQHVHELFDKAGAQKVIWVWTPVKAASVTEYFPGKNYVDWLGFDVDDFKPLLKISSINSFDSMYLPYHQQPIFQNGFPVMVTSTSTVLSNKKPWWNAIWKSMITSYTEIHAVIIGVSALQSPNNNNQPAALNTFNAIFYAAPISAVPLIGQNDIGYTFPQIINAVKFPQGLKNIVYDKGYYWFRNRHTLSLKTLQNDIEGMKNIGINTIERTMPGFYDDKLSKVLKDNGMNLIPRFWIPEGAEVVADDKQMQNHKEIILATIKENLSKKYIVAWNLGDDILYSLSNKTYKPNYFYYQQKYVAWLADICKQIRLMDTVRPIILDLYWDVNGSKRFEYYQKNVPQINTYMLVADAKNKDGLTKPLKDGMAWGKVDVALWAKVPAIKKSGTIPAWQDIENTDYISLNGLLDMEGRKKEAYRKVFNAWSGHLVNPSPIPDVKILKPAKVTTTDKLLTYQIVYNKNGEQWKLYNEEIKGLHFEWYLVRTDQFGNTMFIKKAGAGSRIELPIPSEPQYYQLYCEAILGEDVKMIRSGLNTKLN